MDKSAGMTGMTYSSYYEVLPITNVMNNGLSRGQMQKSHFIFSEHNAAWLDFLAFLTLQKTAFYHFINFYANAQCKMIES